MQLALRPLVTTGVAIVGATALTISPITVAPELHLNPQPLASVSANLHMTSLATDLAAAVNAIIDGFVAAGTEGVAAINDTILAGALILGNTIDVGTALLSGLVTIPTDWFALIGGGFVNAMNLVFGANPITNGITDIANGFFTAGDLIGGGLSGLVIVGGTTLIDIGTYGANVLTGLVTTPATAVGNIITGFQNALTSFAAGDPTTAVQDLIGGFTVAVNTVVTGVTDLFNQTLTLAQNLVDDATQALNILVTVPVAAVQSVVQGFVDAFNGVIPPPPATATVPEAATLRATDLTPVTASAAAAGSATESATESATTPTATPRAAAQLPRLKAARLGTPPAPTAALPGTSSTTATDVAGAVEGGTTAPDADLGAAESGGTAGSDTSGPAASDTSGPAATDTSGTAATDTSSTAGKDSKSSTDAGRTTGKAHRHHAA